jgi:hypothetical protein
MATPVGCLRTDSSLNTYNFSPFIVAYHKGALLWCEGSRGLNKMELSDDRITTLVEDVKLPHEYITRCGHCYSTVIDQGHVTRMMW